MGYKRPKKRHNYDSLYDAAMAGTPMTKQALTLLGDELQQEEEQTEAEQKEMQLADPKIRYVMDKFGYVHDKSCERLIKYPYKDLTWMVDAGVNVKFCSTCFRTALIRRAVSEKEAKKLDDYVSFFERHKISTYMLKELFLIRGIKIRLLGPDYLWVKAEEEEWKIEYDYNEEGYILWHNSYEIIGKKRIPTGDFHKQDNKTHKCFMYAINTIKSYSNKLHLQRQDDKCRQAENALSKHVVIMKQELGGEPSVKTVVKPVKEEEPPIGSFAYFDRLLAMSRQEGRV